MAGQVFLSCGQREQREGDLQDERAMAESIKRILEGEFGLTVFLAARKQTLDDVMRTVDELARSDYFLFIDFVRQGRVPLSLFSHQELAIAMRLGMEYIGFQQDNITNQGFLKYTLANPIRFSSAAELDAAVRAEVGSRGWNPRFSRNLTVHDPHLSNPYSYHDHARAPEINRTITARVRNGRKFEAARNTVCILREWEEPDGHVEQSTDRSALKWAGRSGTYSATILPEDYCDIDLLAISLDPNHAGIYLHSEDDFIPRTPIISMPGRYRLRYRLFADGFGITDFTLDIDYVYVTRSVPMVVHDANVPILSLV